MASWQRSPPGGDELLKLQEVLNIIHEGFRIMAPSGKGSCGQRGCAHGGVLSDKSDVGVGAESLSKADWLIQKQSLDMGEFANSIDDVGLYRKRTAVLRCR
jgi:hypothetical protein